MKLVAILKADRTARSPKLLWAKQPVRDYFSFKKKIFFLTVVGYDIPICQWMNEL